MIVFNCPKCGKEFRAKDEYADRQFDCSSCGAAIRIPELAGLRQQPSVEIARSARTGTVLPPVLKSRITFHCPHCDTQVKVAADAIGKKGRCRTCGQMIQFSQVSERKVVTKSDGLGKVDSRAPDEPARLLKQEPNVISASLEESEAIESDVVIASPRSRILEGLVILPLPLLPLLAGFSHTIVAWTALPCVLAAAGSWYLAWEVAYHPDRVRERIKKLKRLQAARLQAKQEPPRQEQTKQEQGQHQTAAGICKQETEEEASSNRSPPLPMSKGGIMVKDTPPTIIPITGSPTTKPAVPATPGQTVMGCLLLIAVSVGLWMVGSMLSDYLGPAPRNSSPAVSTPNNHRCQNCGARLTGFFSSDSVLCERCWKNAKAFQEELKRIEYLQKQGKL